MIFLYAAIVGTCASIFFTWRLFRLNRKVMLQWSSWSAVYFTLWDELPFEQRRKATNVLNEFFDEEMVPKKTRSELEWHRQQRNRRYLRKMEERGEVTIQ